MNKREKNPEIVPEKLESKINKKILLLILGIVLSFQFYLYTLPKPDDASHLIDVISVINPAASSIAAFYVARRYQNSAIFGKAYFILALGFTMNFIGETIYGIYDVLGLDTTFTAADIFFYTFYPLILVHLILNIKFFKPKIDKITKVWVVSVPVLITGVYSVIALEKSGEIDFMYFAGLMYVILSSTVLSATALGARVFKKGVLGMAWLVLLIGVILLTTGDIWFSYLDTLGQYSLIHPVNLFWYAGYMIVTYALYKHQRII